MITLQVSLSVYVLKLISLLLMCHYITWHRKWWRPSVTI